MCRGRLLKLARPHAVAARQAQHFAQLATCRADARRREDIDILVPAEHVEEGFEFGQPAEHNRFDSVIIAHHESEPLRRFEDAAQTRRHDIEGPTEQQAQAYPRPCP